MHRFLDTVYQFDLDLWIASKSSVSDPHWIYADTGMDLDPVLKMNALINADLDLDPSKT
jgi:hypothetical protein